VTDAPLIQDVLRRESRSILQYVGDAYPWTDSAHAQELGKLQALIHEEQEMVAELARLLQRHHVPPLPSGMYPVGFTTLNFVSLDHILKLLSAYEEQSIADLQAAVGEAKHQESQHLLESFIEMKRRHLENLRALLVSATQPMVAG
jgi:hypothetical protein